MNLVSFFNEATFKVPDVRFGKILVFTYKDHKLNPKLFVTMLAKSLTNIFTFADVRRGLPIVGVGSDEQIDSSLFKFFPRKNKI